MCVKANDRGTHSILGTLDRGFVSSRTYSINCSHDPSLMYVLLAVTCTFFPVSSFFSSTSPSRLVSSSEIHVPTLEDSSSQRAEREYKSVYRVRRAMNMPSERLTEDPLTTGSANIWRCFLETEGWFIPTMSSWSLALDFGVLPTMCREPGAIHRRFPLDTIRPMQTRVRLSHLERRRSGLKGPT
jgi:hypothetical protein